MKIQTDFFSMLDMKADHYKLGLCFAVVNNHSVMYSCCSAALYYVLKTYQYAHIVLHCTTLYKYTVSARSGAGPGIFKRRDVL